MVVPTPDGVINPLVLVAARLAGVDEVYRVGGAQAVAALAYGTETIRAGRQDRRARQRLCRRRQAAGLRHGRHRHDRRPVGGAGDRRRRQRSGLDRRRPARPGRARRRRPVDPRHRLRRACRRASRRPSSASWRRCRAARSPRRAGATMARSSSSPRSPRRSTSPTASRRSISSSPSPIRRRCSSAVRNAGAIFLGRHTPEAIGDYVGGPNHVLPTARSARFSSGLSVLRFLKRTTLLEARPGPASRARAGGDHAGRGRGPRRPCALGRHPAEPLGSDAMGEAERRRCRPAGRGRDRPGVACRLAPDSRGRAAGGDRAT